MRKRRFAGAIAWRRPDVANQLLQAHWGGDSGQLWTAELDVTDAQAAKTAVDSAMDRFSGIDVLVNNAGYGHMGFFEEMNLRDAHEQFATNFFGALNITWMVLPHMRAARRGRIFNISSLGGLLGVQMGSLYCASKFAMEGWSESLAKELSPFGISVTLVEPGPFRTGFLANESIRFSGKPVPDYDERRGQMRAAFEGRNGFQPGDRCGWPKQWLHWLRRMIRRSVFSRDPLPSMRRRRNWPA